MSVYHTEQKRILEKFLLDNRENSFTIDEITQKIKETAKGCGNIPGRSTVYRLVKGLCEEGRVRRFVKNDSRKASYQIVCHENCDSHLHLRCLGCGKFFHMDEGISDELLKRISSSSDFSVDEEETVLYGRCSVCNKI